jgi:glucose/arabinose dehydrogenase
MRSLLMRPTLAVLAILITLPLSSPAATVPPGFTETTISGLTSPTAMAMAPDGRIFVSEQTGSLRVIKNGALLATPFVTLTVDSTGERGLLGIAFDPDFLTNHYLYVYYTATTTAIHNRISRFTATGDVAVAGSEVPLLDLNNLSGATNHNGGALHFGPDRKLFASVGENANGANSQTLSNLLGKLLRINTDGTIPADNPFFGSTTGNNRAIWAIGLRNPFTFAFHPVTGRLFIDDVGENTWEEIDEGIAGANYGWPNTEGPTTNPSYVSPFYYYGHNPECAITGGTFYTPEIRQFPASYVELYFFSDLCAGWIHKVDQAATSTEFATGIANPVDLLVGQDGSLYYLSHNGSVVRVRWDAVLKGDVNGDGATTTADVFYLINYLYGGGPAPVQGGDVDGNAVINPADLTYLINYLYAHGSTPI